MQWISPGRGPGHATAEFVLEAAIDPLNGRAFVVANVLRKLEAKHRAPSFRLAFFLQRRVFQRNVVQRTAVCPNIGGVHHVVLVLRSADRVASGIAAWLSWREAAVSRQLMGIWNIERRCSSFYRRPSVWMWRISPGRCLNPQFVGWAMTQFRRSARWVRIEWLPLEVKCGSFRPKRGGSCQSFETAHIYDAPR